MKNTMKIKSLLSFFVPAALMALSVASCSDYDNGYTEGAIKFQEDFRKAYGDIDPEQDWNLAERGTVTVSTLRESEVKIYALRGNEYVLVGDYEGVNGTRMLGFDMIEGTTSIMVSDGMIAQKCAPGDVVAFSGDTRTTYENTSSSAFVKVEKLTGDVTINGVTYPQYKWKSETDYDNMVEYVPEGKANLNKVTHDFTYVSNGSFIIYPYHWETSSWNTIGLYYYDASNQRHDVDIYKIKESNSGADSELMYMEETVTVIDGSDGLGVYHETYNDGSTFNYVGADDKTNGNWGKRRPNDWGITNVSNKADDGYPAMHMNGWSTEQDESGLRAPFIEYWVGSGSKLQQCEISKTPWPTFDKNKEYQVEIAVRMFNENNSNTYPQGVTFFANDASVSLDRTTVSKTGIYNSTSTFRYGDMDGTKKVHVICKPDENGKIKVGFNISNKAEGNWLAFNGLVIKEATRSTDLTSTDGKGSFGKITRGQGIKIDLPEGTKFGMYLKKTDTFEGKGSKSYQFFSESVLNNPSVVGNGVDVDADGNKIEVQGKNPCYTSTFTVGDDMFIGFEDWPNDTWGFGAGMSDFDLNDLVLAFDGCKPTIINEDPTPGGTWMLVCEDLGGSFDTDYNDVIFKVEHISGQTFANVTALAAGGTLASYIFFTDPTNTYAGDQCLGEIHQLFGEAPAKSGIYTPINVGNDRAAKRGNSVTIQVGKDWTMAYYSTETWQSGTGYNGVNMGGFQIRTLRSGTASPSAEVTRNGNDSFWTNNSQVSVIAAPDKGTAPYILCLPNSYIVDNDPDAYHYTEYVWAWPQELCTICTATYKNGEYSGANGGAYLEFGGWVSNHSQNQDWYKHKNAGAVTVSEEKYVHARSSFNQDMLTIIENPRFATTGKTVYLSDNVVATPGGGDITYRIVYGENETPMPDGDWFPGATNGIRTVAYGTDVTFTPNQAGTAVKVYVTQGGVEKSFNLVVANSSRTNLDFRMDWQWQATSIGRDSGSYYITGDQDLSDTDFFSGEKIKIKALHSGYTGGGSFTARVAGNGTGSTAVLSNHTQDVDEFIITAGQTPDKQGTQFTVTIHFSGDATYNEQDYVYTFNYVSRENVKFIVGSFALAIENGNLVLQNTGGNAEQKWGLVPAGTGYYNLYNMGTHQYLKVNKDNTWQFQYQDDCPGDGSDVGKFKLEQKDGGYIITNRRIEASGAGNRYFGVASVAAGQGINSRTEYGDALVFTKASF